MMRRVGMFALIAVVAVVGVWYGLFWRPESSHLAAARTQEQQAAAEVNTEQATLFQLRAQHSKLGQQEALLGRFLKAVPDGPSLDEVMSTLNSAAANAGVMITTIGTPTPSGWAGSTSNTATVASAGPDSLDISLTVDGSTAQVLKFVTALDNEPRTYVVGSFGLSAGNGALTAGTQQRATLSVSVFFQSTTSNNPTFPG
jgi:Tfp pilus assembly protein PilO